MRIKKGVGIIPTEGWDTITFSTDWQEKECAMCLADAVFWEMNEYFGNNKETLPDFSCTCIQCFEYWLEHNGWHHCDEHSHFDYAVYHKETVYQSKAKSARK